MLQVNPRNAAVLNYYGYMLADRGVRLDEATAMMKRAVSEDPTNGAYLDSMGWSYYKHNKLAEAEEYLRKAVERTGHDPTILDHLGDVYYKRGAPIERRRSGKNRWSNGSRRCRRIMKPIA